MKPADRRRTLEILAMRPTYRGKGLWGSGSAHELESRFIESRHVYPLLREGLVALSGPTRNERRAGKRHRVAKRGCRAGLTPAGQLALAIGLPCPECARELIPTWETPHPQLICQEPPAGCGGMFSPHAVLSMAHRADEMGAERAPVGDAGSTQRGDVAPASEPEKILGEQRSLFPGGGFS